MNKYNSMRQGVGYIIRLIVLVIPGWLCIQLISPYFDHYVLTTVLEQIKSQPDVPHKNAGELDGIIKQQLYVNSVQLPLNAVVIKRRKNALAILVDYEVRKHFFANVELTVSFKDEIEVPST